MRRRTLHSGPSQKTWSSLWSEVAAFSGGWVVRPDLLGDVLDDPAGKGLTGRGEGFPGLGLASCLQERLGALTPLVDGARQNRENG